MEGMNKMDFKKGDVVQLKSGGPLMTIQGFSESNQAKCVWLDGNKKFEETFELETLEIYESSTGTCQIEADW